MSRPSSMAQRNLTLTEELEKLEQSITLTLQEIDHNFSKAHRIVTSSLLPVVEKYAEHSKDVWEGSKFWKQFFEASANVSLSGYEEPPAEDETATEDNSQTTPSSSYASSLAQDETITPKNRTKPTADDSTFASTPSHITPRAHTTGKSPLGKASNPSPYETLKYEVQEDSEAHDDDPSSSTLPSTPRPYQRSPGQQSSPFFPPSTSRHPSNRTPANDVLLHRILDKNWRLQATPHSQAHRRNLAHRGPGKAAETPLPSTRKRAKQGPQDPESLDSSPAVPVPELHAEIFGSPVRRPRVPGVSVLTPARRRGSADGKPGGIFGGEALETGTKADIWDSDSDEEAEMEGMSPPKTMQFHVPQSRLLRTPAREASKRIVEDLLLTAGGNVTDNVDADSPSVIGRGAGEDEDTF